MPAGDSFRSGWASQINVVEETAASAGVFVTASVAIPFLKESLNLNREKRTLKTIDACRDSRWVFTGKDTVEGDVSAYMNVGEAGLMYLLKHGMGGTVASTVLAVAGTYLHTFKAGNTEDYASTVGTLVTKSLSFHVGYGETFTGGMAFSGCKVNGFTIKGTLGEPIEATFNIVGMAGSMTNWTIPTATFGNLQPLSFVGVTVREADNIASITSGTALKFQSFELSVKNNLETGDKARSLGSRGPTILPAGDREITLKLGQRYDTTTNWSKFIDDTITALRIYIDSGVTMAAGAGATTYGMYFDMPNVKWSTKMPEVGDAGVVSQELEAIVYGGLTNTSYAIQAGVYNTAAGY